MARGNNMLVELNLRKPVEYHSIIGGEITSRDHWVNSICKTKEGEWCAWIDGKGLVSLDALSQEKVIKPIPRARG